MEKTSPMFDMTYDGHLRARKYLIEIGKLEEFENNRTSVDGYLLVAYANYYKEKEANKSVEDM